MICTSCGVSYLRQGPCPVCAVKSVEPVPRDWSQGWKPYFISKRQEFDKEVVKHHLVGKDMKGLYRIWWVWRLFDMIPIYRVQDPTCLYQNIQPQPQPTGLLANLN